MSEFDESGRRGFLRRFTPGTPGSPREGDAESERDRERSMAKSLQEEAEDLREALRFFGGDSTEFRRRLDRILAEYDAQRRRATLLRDQLGDAERQNEKLVATLQEAKQQIELLKEEVDKLCAPPNGYGVFIRSNKDSTAEIVGTGQAAIARATAS